MRTRFEAAGVKVAVVAVVHSATLLLGGRWIGKDSGQGAGGMEICTWETKTGDL